MYTDLDAVYKSIWANTYNPHKDKDKDKDEMLKRLNVCNVFEDRGIKGY